MAVISVSAWVGSGLLVAEKEKQFRRLRSNSVYIRIFSASGGRSCHIKPDAICGLLCLARAMVKPEVKLLEPFACWLHVPRALSSIISVDIRYPSRSRFLDVCEAAIREHRAELQVGGMVHVNLEEGGYEGRVVVTIHANDRTLFGTDWEGAEPTRFPARIRAAAAALRNCGCEGRFEVSHSDGSPDNPRRLGF